MPGHRWKPGLPQACQLWLGDLAANLRKTSVWQPLVKNVLSTTITITLGVIPAVVNIYGKSTYLGTMTSIFGQPGQRFGEMVETLSLIALGTLFGLVWSNLGLYLSGLVDSTNINAAWAIRASFFFSAVILHGVLRSSAPRLFQLVLFFILVNLSVLTSSQNTVSLSEFKAVIYPIFTALGVVILVNVTIFPQFSSGFLGTSTIETLSEIIDCFQEAGNWFMTSTQDGAEEKTSPKAMRIRLAALTNKKPKLRARLGSCKGVQAECNFELVLAVLPPRSMKPISVTMMTRLVQVTTSLINACESKFALAAYDEGEYDSDEPKGEEMNGTQSESDSSSEGEMTEHQRNIALVKPIREIESGDLDVLEHIMSQIQYPTKAMQDQIQVAVYLITSALAYCYDVSQLPSGSPSPAGILLQEMDIRTETFAKALTRFDIDSAAALDSAAAATDGNNSMGDIVPRMETHLVSCFLISISQASRQVLEMLKHARTLVERRQTRSGRRKLYWPHISWKKWLVSGGEQDGNVLPENARKEARTGYGSIEDTRDDGDIRNNTDVPVRPIVDEEAVTGAIKGDILPQNGEGPRQRGPQAPQDHKTLRIRGLAADTVEFFQGSDHLTFALKMAVAALLVTWPAFVPSLNAWYGSVRGTWATLQLILVFEVSIVRQSWNYFYDKFVSSRSWYVPVSILALVSLADWKIATVVRVDDDAPWQIYVKRLVCFLVGGTVALAIEMFLFPVRARDRLVESLVSSISQVSIMESSVAAGVDSPNAIDTKSQVLNANFKNAKEKAEQALDAARTFLPFCLTEPRLKGNFGGQALVYGEMIYVLFQIIERMDNMLHIRKLFGRGVLEELHDDILPYRRNVAGCVTLTLFIVQEALTTRLPLPQYLPSSRVAQLRSVARVRELLVEREKGTRARTAIQTPTGMMSLGGPSTAANDTTPNLITRQAFLAWKASSAGMMEIVEYLEELVDLAKLLVGVNAFRSGLLQRPRFQELNAKTNASKVEAEGTNTNAIERGKGKSPQEEGKRRRLASFGRRSSTARPEASDTGLRRRQTAGARPAATGDSAFDNDGLTERDDISWSLQRVMTKRMEESRSKRRYSGNTGGKRALRNVQTWAG
ncbi:hypothetical protein NUW58_g3994 [Xylaria curta]|uniref:Uncharacterized protein n=1 Tax=Xylaria curta TaxID=42375 RepID=A0ACC1P9W2_9PEZI|nr:hypothetical protein NUW58_g3994 [Xylaria curta]